jgi:hypothetical protein
MLPQPHNCLHRPENVCQESRNQLNLKDLFGPYTFGMAERVGFEPTVGVNLHTLSKRAP